MSKITTIILREYLTRVKKKSFIIVTLLIPFLMGALMTAPILFAKFTTGIENFVVVDESGYFAGKLDNTSNLTFSYFDVSLDTAKLTYKDQGFKGILYIPDIDIERPLGITYYSDTQLGLNATSHIRGQIENVVEKLRYNKIGLDKKIIDKLNFKLDLDIILMSEKGEKQGNTVVAAGLSYTLGFLLYMILLMYGTMIMKGVVEEKQNRIVEVMISSVKPFELMFGKIIGITGVALTQVLIWFLLLSGIYFGLYVTFLPELADVAMNTQQQVQIANSNVPQITSIMMEIQTIPMTKVITVFLLFFSFGYLLYAAMFAALGSVIGEETENNSASLIVVLPIIIALMTMLQVIEHPSSPIAFWMSMVPLFSPIVMVARAPFDVPVWEVAVSFILLFGSFIFTTWISGRIYRTGILLYGKKITLKEVLRWMFRKEIG